MRKFAWIPNAAQLDRADGPLIVSPDELAAVVEALNQQSASVIDAIEHPPTERVAYERKNSINMMSQDFAIALRKKYLKDTSQIQAFLAAPENAEILAKYELVTEEFQLKVIAYRKDYQTFDKLMLYLVDLVVGRDSILAANKRLTRAMLFYMYWNCDIGEVDDAATQ